MSSGKPLQHAPGSAGALCEHPREARRPALRTRPAPRPVVRHHRAFAPVTAGHRMASAASAAETLVFLLP